MKDYSKVRIQNISYRYYGDFEVIKKPYCKWEVYQVKGERKYIGCWDSLSLAKDFLERRYGI